MKAWERLENIKAKLRKTKGDLSESEGVVAPSSVQTTATTMVALHERARALQKQWETEKEVALTEETAAFVLFQR